MRSRCIKIGFVFFLLCASLFSALAELPPSVYEAKQHSATEYLRVQVVDASSRPGPASSTLNIRILAIVTQVMRTGSGVKIGSVLEIRYTVTSRPAAWCGPGEVPILKVREDTVAYLVQPQGKNFYIPAAGAMSFNNF